MSQYKFLTLTDASFARASARGWMDFDADRMLATPTYRDKVQSDGKVQRADVQASNAFVQAVRKAAKDTKLETVAENLKPADVRERMATGDCVARVTVGRATFVVAPAWALEGTGDVEADTTEHQVIADAGIDKREQVEAYRANYRANVEVLAEARELRQIGA